MTTAGGPNYFVHPLRAKKKKVGAAETAGGVGGVGVGDQGMTEGQHLPLG